LVVMLTKKSQRLVGYWSTYQFRKNIFSVDVVEVGKFRTFFSSLEITIQVLIGFTIRLQYSDRCLLSDKLAASDFLWTLFWWKLLFTLAVF
jgi:hypothetical protein